MGKNINERCPFSSECERKKCEYKFKENECSYYIGNARPGEEIDGMEVTADILDLFNSEGERREIEYIDIDLIHPHPDNPRKDVGDVSELAESIKHSGIMQNLTVVPFYDEYRVIIGHRRLAASKLAGLSEVPCVVVEMSEKEQIATMLSENMQRVDLTVVEQAQGVQMLFDLGESVVAISEKTGFSESTVRKRMKVATLLADKLKEAEKRGGTLQDFVKIAEIEDEKDRKEVLRAVGTSNFKYALASASNRQTQRKTKAEWIEKLSSFATPIKTTAGKKYVTCQYFLWSPKNYNIPEDKDSINYYYEDAENIVRIYKDYTPEEAEKLAKENIERQEAEKAKDARMNELAALSRQFEKLRWDFVKEYRGDKSHAYNLTKFLIDFLYDYIGYKNIEGESELREFLRLPDDEDFRESEEYLRILCKTPQKLLLTFIALQVENCKKNTWDWYGSYSEQELLTAYYKVLRRCGYEMADAEEAFYDGSHEAYYVEEDNE